MYMDVQIKILYVMLTVTKLSIISLIHVTIYEVIEYSFQTVLKKIASIMM